MPARHNHAAVPRGGDTELILVVDDEEPIRRVTGRILQRAGYEVLTASSGPEALDLLASSTSPISLLFTDLSMPGMNGRELAERAAALRPGLRVLLMSGSPDDVVLAAMRGGRMLLLRKPFSVGELLMMVRRAIDTPSVA